MVTETDSKERTNSEKGFDSEKRFEGLEERKHSGSKGKAITTGGLP